MLALIYDLVDNEEWCFLEISECNESTKTNASKFFYNLAKAKIGEGYVLLQDSQLFIKKEAVGIFMTLIKDSCN